MSALLFGKFVLRLSIGSFGRMENGMKRKIEILAPAGSYEGMKAAMNAGCDAVYIGGSSFGARAYANNPEDSMLMKAIEEAHIRDKRLYLTVNTLLKEKEHANQLYSFLERFYRIGLDAVIVQDVGVLHFIYHNFPGLPIHASTQMNLTMAQGVKQLESYGVTRLVTARELSLTEIRELREHTELEIETFVHGALCYCYSGQCLMSSMIGGRSGNRGRCAQPCRMPYQFYSDEVGISQGQGKYLLSPRDINTIALIPELILAGIDSFKIEGRMKRPEYAASTAHLYRKYVDYYMEYGEERFQGLIRSKEYRSDMILLQDIYNRGGFSEGYGNTYHGKKMMSFNRPNHSGVLVGAVKEIKGSQVAITLKEKVNPQDILEIHLLREQGYEFTVKDTHNQGDLLWTKVGLRPEERSHISPPKIHAGAEVYRTRNQTLLMRLSKEFLEKDVQLGMKGWLKARIGERLSLTVSYNDTRVTAFQDSVQQALKQPMTPEKLESPIRKTGDTHYFFEELTVEADDNIFVPVAWLNEIRREALGLLQNAILDKYKRSKAIVLSAQNDSSVATDSTGFVVLIQSLQQFEAANSFQEVTSIYAEYDAFAMKDLKRMAKEAEEAGKGFYLSLPHICRLSVYERLEKDLYDIIKMDSINGFLVKNFEEITLIQSLMSNEKREKEMILNYNMYTYNKAAFTFWRENGIHHFTAPVELNGQELKELGIGSCDMVVYGYLPVMVSTQCLFDNTSGCIGQKSAGVNRVSASGRLKDRLGKEFYVKTNCTGCYHIIYNSQPLALHKQAENILALRPRNIRIDFVEEDYDMTRNTISTFLRHFHYGNSAAIEIPDYTTGHFKRGVE